jgi:DNA-binding NarL/FixJ family response regulator
MSGPTVLVVDDHPSFRALARAFLVEEGFEIVGEAPDGLGAVRLAALLQPKVVLLDVQLPDMDGFEVARIIRATGLPTRVVLVSTREARDYGPRIPESGAAGFLTKSRLSGDTLRAILGEHAEGGNR